MKFTLAALALVAVYLLFVNPQGATMLVGSASNQFRRIVMILQGRNPDGNR